MSRHVVFGAGLIGGYLAGVLLSQGHEVGLVARPGVQQRLARGLRLTDYQGHEASVDSFEFIDPGAPEVQAADYLWLTVKCTAVSESVEQLAGLVGPSTKIYCCQNGLGSEQIVKSRFPENEVLRVMVQFNVAEIKPGHLHRGSEGAMTLEALPPDSGSPALAEKINCPLLPVHSCAEMYDLLWAKLQLNLGNGVNALADIPVKSMLEQRDFRRCFAVLMNELLAVTDARGIVLPKVTALSGRLIPKFMSMPDWLFKILGNKMLAIDPTVKASMWWDLSQGKHTEIHYLNGAVVEAGEEEGVDCPANRTLLNMIVEAEKGERQPGISATELLRALT